MKFLDFGSLSTIWRQPVYPILFTWYSILFFYSHNQEAVTTSVLSAPLGYSLVIIIVLMVLLFLMYRDWHKSAMITAILSVMFFLYSYLLSMVADARVELGPLSISPHDIVHGLYVLILVGLGWWLLRTSRSISGSTLIFNTATFFLVALVLLNIIPIEMGRATTLRQGVDVEAQQSIIGSAESVLDYQPDVYYLIFDRYAGARTLEQYYGYDNAEFIESLEGQGFFVANNSHANYPRTIFSLSSSTNMNYLQDLIYMGDDSKSEATTLRWLLSNNAVGQILKQEGYRYFHYGNWYDLSREIGIAENILPGHSDFIYHNNFSTKLLDTTMYSTIMHRYLPEVVPSEWNTQHRQWAEFQVEKLVESPAKASPKFVFGHVLMPHEPFIFDAQCQAREVGISEFFAEPEDYRDQLICTNSMILEIVEAILAKSDNPPIIIIQSDEGPADYAHSELPDRQAFEGASIGPILERNRILNAFYFPDKDYSQLSHDITPVNNFRTVLRQYFDMDLPNLEDRLYVMSSSDDAFNLIDVTERVEEAEAGYEGKWQ